MKITLVPLGAFATNAVTMGMVMLPPHPAYTKPTLTPMIYRNVVLSRVGETDPVYRAKGDTVKGVKALYRLSELPSPPLRLILGKDSLGMCRGKMAMVLKDVEDYASWSDDIELDE